MALIILRSTLDLARRIGNNGCVRFRAWICAFSSTHNTKARSGGFRYKPTISRTFSTNSGSRDSLKVSTRCGCNPNARQMRLTALWLIPHRRAIKRVLQCVASRASISRVRRSTRSTCGIADLPRRPGAGLIEQPIQPPRHKAAPPFSDRLLGPFRSLALTTVFGFPCRAGQAPCAPVAPEPARSSAAAPTVPTFRCSSVVRKPTRAIGRPTPHQRPSSYTSDAHRTILSYSIYL